MNVPTILEATCSITNSVALNFKLRAGELGGIVFRMSPVIGPYPIEIHLEGDVDAGTLKFSFVDPVSEQTYSYVLPASALPSLHRSIGDFLAAHPDMFPTVIGYRFT